MLDNIEESLKALNSEASSPESRQQVLIALSNAIVFVPVLRFENVSGARDEKKVKIVTDTQEGRREVSVFTREEKFFSWASGTRYQCFSVAAGDLALTLPPGTSLVVDPGTDCEHQFSAAEVQFLAYPVAAEEELRQESISLSAPDQFEGPAEEDYSQTTVDELSQTERGLLIDELQRVVDGYPTVEEAYLVEVPSGRTSHLLGLLSGPLQSEERFSLIESIAEISRKYFGEAGAIEVYDDLHSPSSSSWELFSAQAPFFSRTAGDGGAFALAEQILQEETPGESRFAHIGREAMSLWQKLRKKYRLSR